MASGSMMEGPVMSEGPAIGAPAGAMVVPTPGGAVVPPGANIAPVPGTVFPPAATPPLNPPPVGPPPRVAPQAPTTNPTKNTT
jgi:hypothetical protein